MSHFMSLWGILKPNAISYLMLIKFAERESIIHRHLKDMSLDFVLIILLRNENREISSLYNFQKKYLPDTIVNPQLFSGT